jgi:hypothetical protein
VTCYITCYITCIQQLLLCYTSGAAHHGEASGAISNIEQPRNNMHAAAAALPHFLGRMPRVAASINIHSSTCILAALLRGFK